MVRFNKTRAPNRAPIQTQQVATGRTGNNAPGFARDAKSELFLLAVSNFVGQDTAYEKAAARDDRFVQLIHAATAADTGWMKRFLPWLRGEANMRTAALVGAVEATRALVDLKIPGGRQLVDAVLQRADEPGEMLGYIKSRGYKLSKPVKRGIADAVERLYTEYTLLKYDTASHAYRFADVLELCHPRSKAAWQGQLYKFALDRRHHESSDDYDLLRMWQQHEGMRKRWRGGDYSFDAQELKAGGFTWEDVLSELGSKVPKKDLWEALIPTMGYMALMRNLRNFTEAGISPMAAELVARTLTSPEAVAKSRQLPLRFLSAYNAAAGNLRWAYPLQKALDLSLSNVPWFGGKTLILIDTSGSMNDGFSKDGTLKRWDAATLFGLAVAKRCDNPTVVSYSTASRRFPFDKHVSLLPQVEAFRRDYFYGNGTATQATVAQWHHGHNRIIILTDEQANYHGYGDVCRGVPSSTMVVTFNLAGYRFGHAAGGSDRRVTIGGLTDQAFKLLPILEQRAAGGWPF